MTHRNFHKYTTGQYKKKCRIHGTKMEGHLSYFDFLFGISCEPSVLCTDITRHIILLYQSFSESVSQPFPPNHKPDELGAEILRECSLPTTCHMSHVACHMSHVMCHVSSVKCHVSHVTCHMSLFFSPDKVVKLISGGFVINGAYRVYFYQAYTLPLIFFILFHV